MKKRVFVCLIIGCISLPVILCQNVKVKIIGDNDSQPLPHATIQVITPDSVLHSSYTTNEDGGVQMKLPLDAFDMHVSYIGYTDIRMSVKNRDRKEVDLGTVAMQMDSTNILNEVVVTAQPIVEHINKSVVIPSAQQLKASTSSLTLLEQLQLPGLFVNPIMQEVKIVGVSGVIYRINGVNASFQEVTALKPSQIQRVEYSPTPSARDLDSNSGVINIIMKKENVGTHVNLNGVGAMTTGFINGFANVKTVFSKSELSLDYSTSWRDYTQRWSREEETYVFPTHTLNQVKRGRNAPFGYLSQNINLNYTYNGTKNVFVIKFQNALNNTFDRNYIDIYQNQSTDPFVFRNIHAKMNSYVPSLDLYYIRKMGENKGLEFNMVGTLMNSDYSRTLVDTYADKNQSFVNNTTDGSRKSLIAEGFYYSSKKGVKYQMGLKGAYSHTRNVYNISNVDKVTQFSLYPYVSIEGKIVNVAYTLGTGLQVLNTENNVQSKQYYRNLTTLSLFYNKKSTWSVRNVLRYTPSFPSLAYMSDADQRQDSLMVVRGNPLLEPAQALSDRLSFMYQIKKNIRATLTLNATKTIDPIRNSYYYDPLIHSFVTQRFNQNSESQLGAALDLYISPLLKFLTVSMGAAWDTYQSKGIDYSHRFDNFYWYIFCNAQIKDFSFNVGYRQASKDLAGQAIYLNENYSAVGMSYKKKNFSLTANLMYPLSSGTRYGTELMSSAVKSNKDIYIRDNANMFVVGFSYNFSWGKSLFGVNKSLRNSDWDSGIMKVQDN